VGDIIPRRSRVPHSVANHWRHALARRGSLPSHDDPLRGGMRVAVTRGRDSPPRSEEREEQ
jgi:hypothetical protein